MCVGFLLGAKRGDTVSHEQHISLCVSSVRHLVVGVLDDSVESRDQRLLQMEAAGVAGDVGFW